MDQGPSVSPSQASALGNCWPGQALIPKVLSVLSKLGSSQAALSERCLLGWESSFLSSEASLPDPLGWKVFPGSLQSFSVLSV